MRLFRRYIRSLLKEMAAHSLPDLSDAVVYVKNGPNRLSLSLKSDKKLLADIVVSKDYGDWSVVTSYASVSGWGPFMYDIAMELATQAGQGLVSDRSEVSERARKVWEYYFHNRSDVQKSDAIVPYREDDEEYEDEILLNTSFRKAPDLVPKLKQADKWVEW